MSPIVRNKIIAIIPSRYQSSRLPGKPLIDLNGKTMIQRVYQQAKKCEYFEEVIIATDNDLIYNHASEYATVMMTSAAHTNGTERCNEIIEKIGGNYDVIVNVQGDEPFVDPKALEQLCRAFEHPCEIATLYNLVENNSESHNSNTIKVVTDCNDNAMYFSRSTIPFLRNEGATNSIKKHIGVYGFSIPIFKKICTLPVVPIEYAESLEQLRWMYYGYKIKMIKTDYQSYGIDVPADIELLKKKGLI